MVDLGALAILETLHRIAKVGDKHITFDSLKATRIGKVVGKLSTSHEDVDVRETAEAIVNRWRPLTIPGATAAAYSGTAKRSLGL